MKHSAQSHQLPDKLNALCTEFERGFGGFDSCHAHFTMFTYPFTVTVKGEHNTHMRLTELQNDSASQPKHRKLEVPKFYQYLDKIRYAALFVSAVTALMLFGSTCEHLFSHMKINQSN